MLQLLLLPLRISPPVVSSWFDRLNGSANAQVSSPHGGGYGFGHDLCLFQTLQLRHLQALTPQVLAHQMICGGCGEDSVTLNLNHNGPFDYLNQISFRVVDSEIQLVPLSSYLLLRLPPSERRLPRE